MLALGFSTAMHGIDGYVVRVEADASPGTPSFVLVGLPDRALGEARERVRAAIANCGFRYPAGRLIVNLAPADIRPSIRYDIPKTINYTKETSVIHARPEACGRLLK